MDVLWDRGVSTAADVIAASAGRGWNQSTVRTMLARLVEKGALKYEVDGPRYVYRPAVTRRRCVREESRSFLERVFKGDVGSLLLHLRDPVRALTAVRSVCRGRLLSVDAYDLPLTLLSRAPLARLDAVGRPWWWKPNAAGIERMLRAAGFRVVGTPSRVFMPPGPQHPRPRSWSDVASAVRSRDGRELLFAARFGSPHLATLAEPA